MQPQIYEEPRKRPKYLADIVYPLRGDLEFIPIDVDMNGATSLDGFSLKVSGTGVATERTELKYDNATDTATATQVPPRSSRPHTTPPPLNPENL